MSYKLPLFAAAAFLGGYMLISNRQLRVNKYELKVSKLPKNFVGKKILLLADLHKKRYGHDTEACPYEKAKTYCTDLLYFR